MQWKDYPEQGSVTVNTTYQIQWMSIVLSRYSMKHPCRPMDEHGGVRTRSGSKKTVAGHESLMADEDDDPP